MKTRCIPYALLLCLFFSLPIAAAGKAVTFKEGGKGSLTINNQASFDVIIYAGKVVNNNVLGGIRAGKSRTFDLTTLKLPSKNGAFLVRAAAFETYSKKKARVTEDDVLYTGLVVYDLNKPGDTTDLNIHKDIDQNTWFSVSNESQFVLELRAGRPDGELITSLPPLQENKRVFLKPLSSGMPHEIYAAYVYAGAQSNGVKTSTVDADRQRVMPSGFDGGVRRMVFHGPKDISALRPPAVSYFRLVNDTYEDILFMDGNTRLTDQQGLQRAAAGRTATFELAAMTGERGKMYTDLIMEFDSMRTLRLPGFSAKSGVVYMCTVTMRNGNLAYELREAGVRENKLEDMRVTLFLGD